MTPLIRNLAGMTCLSMISALALAQSGAPGQPGQPGRAPQMRQHSPVPEMTEPETAIIPLQNAAVGSVFDVVSQTAFAFGGAIVVPHESTNTLVIVAEKQTALPKLTALVKELDKPASTSGDERTVQSVSLKKAYARDAAAAIDRLMVGRGWVRVWADERSNTLWLRGSSSEVAAATELAARFDAAAPEAPDVTAATTPTRLRFLSLKHAHAPNLATTVSALFASKSDRETRIVADARSQTLVVQCTDAQFERISEVVTSLDVPARDGEAMREDVTPPTPPAGEPRPAERPQPTPARPAKPGQP